MIDDEFVNRLDQFIKVFHIKRAVATIVPTVAQRKRPDGRDLKTLSRPKACP